MAGKVVLRAMPLVVLLGCSSDKPTATPPPPPAATPPPAAAPPSTTRSITVTGVYVDPTIVSACGISQPKAFFQFDSANLSSADTTTLDKLAACMAGGTLKGKAVEVIGRTDPRGTDEYNKQLGKSRADSVADYLTTKGVEKAKLLTRSTGEEKASGTDENGWAYDRRVDIRLAK